MRAPVLLLMALLLGGCFNKQTAQVPCGTGNQTVVDGKAYCVYAAAIIEDGFLCPATLPNRFLVDGYVVCGGDAKLPDTFVLPGTDVDQLSGGDVQSPTTADTNNTGQGDLSTPGGDTGSSQPDPTLSCTTASDCQPTVNYYKPVSSEDDCYCPGCFNDYQRLLNKATHALYKQQWETHCTAWSTRVLCASPVCPPSVTRACENQICIPATTDVSCTDTSRVWGLLKTIPNVDACQTDADCVLVGAAPGCDCQPAIEAPHGVAVNATYAAYFQAVDGTYKTGACQEELNPAMVCSPEKTVELACQNNRCIASFSGVCQ